MSGDFDDVFGAGKSIPGRPGERLSSPLVLRPQFLSIRIRVAISTNIDFGVTGV